MVVQVAMNQNGWRNDDYRMARNRFQRMLKRLSVVMGWDDAC